MTTYLGININSETKAAIAELSEILGVPEDEVVQMAILAFHFVRKEVGPNTRIEVIPRPQD